MRKDRFLNLLESTATNLRNLTASKGEEYTNNGSADAADQHVNFKRLAEELGLTPEHVLMVMLDKHLNSIKSYVRTGRVYSEPIEGRIDDAILYLILLKGLAVERVEVPMSPLVQI